MLFFAPALLALAGLASAQSSNGTASTLDIEVIEANFDNAQLVPNLLEKFDPEGTLAISFSGQEISIGQNLSIDAVKSSPSLSIHPADNATDLNGNDKYTVMMVDGDIVGTDARTTPLTRHWLVNGATLNAGSAPYAVTYDSATTITDYAGPYPADGSGSHRYTILVYLQPSSFTPPSNLSQANTPLSTMLVPEYVSSTGLGALVAANYFQVENGQATVTVMATSSVNPSTLAAAASTTGSGASGSMMSMSEKSGSASGTAASGAASSKPSGAASMNKEMGWGVAVGAVGLVGAVLGAGMGF